MTAQQGQGGSQVGNHQHQNDFWQFSLAVYGQPGVAEECLALQDRFGLNINLLLFCAWLGHRGVRLGRDDLEGASRMIASWHDHVVRPLRGVRRHMKLHHEDASVLRSQIQRVEIEAEQVEQAILFAYAQDIASRVEPDALGHNVNEYLAMMSGDASDHGAPALIATVKNKSRR